jgi:calcineurin-like phosphoesterase family protein
MTEWLISDTHFGHFKIIEYCQRPFQSVPEMNTAMVRKWHNRVKPEDTVYHLGDVGILKEENKAWLRSAIRALPGRKVLIRGNHDKSPAVMRDLGFDVVCEAMLVCVPNLNATWALLNHRPMKYRPAWGGDPSVPNIDYVIHGHVHNSTPESRAEHEGKGEVVKIPDFNINVSVEVIGYEPVGLERVVKRHARRLKEKNG